MTHDSYREFIQRELDDDLSADEMALLEAHVAICAECRREREQYQSLAMGLARLSKVMPERSFVSQITPDIKSAVKTVQEKAPRRVNPVWWRGLSVAAVVVLAIGWSTQWSFGVHQPDAPKQQVALGPDAASRTQPTTLMPQLPVTPGSQQTTDAAPVGESPETTASPTTAPEQTEQPITSSVQSQTPQTQGALKSGGSVHGTESSSASTKPVQPSGTSAVSGIAPGSTGTGTGTTVAMGGTSANGTGTATSGNVGGAAVGAAPGLGLMGGTTGGGLKPAALIGGQAPAPAATIIGPTPAMSDTYNAHLQAQVNSGDAAVQWAIDPYQSVQHSLTKMGFAASATVMPTNSNERIRVLQSGTLFEITLQQPFDHGLNGIWVPVQIGRAINENKPEAMEKPVLDYFNSLADSGALASRQQIFVVHNTTPGSLTVTVVEEHKDAKGQDQWVNVQYVFSLHQNADLTWVLHGAPVAITSA